MLEERTLYRHARWRLILLGLTAAAVAISFGSNAQASLRGQNGPIVFNHVTGNVIGHHHYQLSSVSPRNKEIRPLSFIKPGFLFDEASVSPDGKQLLYSAEYNYGAKKVVRLITGRTPTWGTDISKPGEWASNPSWSPDGESILYATYDDKTSSSKIIVVDAQTRESRVVYQASESVWVTSQAWSPDSKQITFQLNDAVYVVDADGSSDARKVFDDFGRAAAWSQGTDAESRIAFETGNKTGNCQIIETIKPDGSDLRQVSKCRRPIFDYNPLWSPDGKRIAFRAIDFATSWGGIQDVLANGDQQRTLATGMYTGDFTWSPDGRQLALYAQYVPGSTIGDLLTVPADGSTAAATVLSGNVTARPIVWAPSFPAL